MHRGNRPRIDKDHRATFATKLPPVGTRQRLVQAARELLEAGGHGAASVQAIADRAGVATGALYRHFPSKAELLVEVFREAAKGDLAALRAAASSGSCVERLEAAVTTFARRALSNRRLAWTLVYEPVDPLVDAERLVYRREYCRHMAVLLRQGIVAGELPDQDAELSAAALVGAIAEALVGPLSPIAGRIASKKNVIAPLIRFCRRSVGARDGAHARRP
ncbi:MAG TPA: TetR/AcrR family transcriptional regulator [Candidatus Margulisiibacteriota bacterium]|nr:TetR/AcrR family transcriptional regulator [Candidatus Margulisiibacteriota bacterium]